jgi:hypothetical protein
LCVLIHSYCDNVKLQNVTLTVEKGTLFLDATHRLDVVDIHALLIEYHFMHGKVTVRTLICVHVPINSNCDNVKFQNVSVTLTFKVGT